MYQYIPSQSNSELMNGQVIMTVETKSDDININNEDIIVLVIIETYLPLLKNCGCTHVVVLLTIDYMHTLRAKPTVGLLMTKTQYSSPKKMAKFCAANTFGLTVLRFLQN